MLRVRLSGLDATPEWLFDLDVEIVDDDAEVALWHPAGLRPAETTLAFLDRDVDPYGLCHPDAARFAATRADRYAGDAVAARSALEWIARGAAHPQRGAVFLGSLGTAACNTPVGTPISVGARCIVGRSAECDLVLRQGPHSDQNLCARRHTLLARTPDGIVVTDLGSTNGTRVGGRRLEAPVTVSPGQEIAFADCFRMLVCG